jgi:urease gamma subunit
MVKIKNATSNKPLKPMNPRSPDLKYTGVEPEWPTQPAPETRNSALIGAFSWYNYHYGKKDARELLVEWLHWRGDTEGSRTFARISEHLSMLTAGWLARMHMKGLELNERELTHITDTITQHTKAAQSVKRVVVEAQEEVRRPTIQDRLRDIMITAAGDMEGMYDELMASDVKLTADYKPMAVLRGHNVAPPLVREIRESWITRRLELAAVTAGRDSQLVEGYGNFSRTQLKNLAKFVDLVIADCDSYVQVKKAERAPRRRKPVSPERQTAKFRYLREFEELKLKSVPVTGLVNAQEAWLYDTKKRKLIYVTADSHAGTFTVKGNNLIGFDPTNSVQKTLRKPAEQIRALLTGGVASTRKYFKDIKATEVKFGGRGNENLILLKVR